MHWELEGQTLELLHIVSQPVFPGPAWIGKLSPQSWIADQGCPTDLTLEIRASPSLCIWKTNVFAF